MFASLGLSLFATACTGSISGGLAPNGNGTGSGVGGNRDGLGGAGGITNLPAPPAFLPAESACVDNGAGPPMLRRLSAGQFVASIVDLFRDPNVRVAPVFNDPSVMGFSVDSISLLVQGLNADQLMTNAEAIAAWAVANHLMDVTGCASTDAGCPESFIRGFGKRAFRAPLSDASVAAYQGLFSAEASFNDGVTAVLAAMLQSPRFLYRTELGPDGGVAPAVGTRVELTPYEVATGLSYLMTGSAPDALLMQAADAAAAGSLTVPDMLDQQVQRLLGDPRSQAALLDFMNSWLGLDRLYTTVKDDSVFQLTPALRDAMAAETRGLILDTFATGGGMSALLTADHSFLNKDLAQYYGFDTSGLGSDFVKVPYPAGGPREGGVLAHAGILTGYARADVSSPTQRGHLVRTHLLCQYVPPPPAVLDTTFKPQANPTTTRAHYEQSHSVGGCGDCHKLMDKIGFGFEHYDAFGRHRDTEGPSNATDGDVPFDGLTQLSAYLAQDADVGRCLVRYWSFYAYGSASWDQDACTYAAIRDNATAGGNGLRDILTAIIRAPHFTSRTQAP